MGPGTGSRNCRIRGSVLALKASLLSTAMSEPLYSIAMRSAIRSAFRIADRIAMLYNGSLIAVDNKDAFKASTDPRIRQFLDPVPGPITESPAVQDHLRELAGLTGVKR